MLSTYFLKKEAESGQPYNDTDVNLGTQLLHVETASALPFITTPLQMAMGAIYIPITGLMRKVLIQH